MRTGSEEAGFRSGNDASLEGVAGEGENEESVWCTKHGREAHISSVFGIRMNGNKRRFCVRKMDPWSACRCDSNKLDSREKNYGFSVILLSIAARTYRVDTQMLCHPLDFIDRGNIDNYGAGNFF